MPHSSSLTQNLIHRPQIPVGRAPITTVFAPSGRSTLATHAGESFLKVFDAGSLTEIETIPVGKSPANSIFSADGRHAYATNWGCRLFPGFYQ
jgi:DNA-binding beta-propeller fold protein YncE